MQKPRPSLRIITLLENNPYHSEARVRPHMEALAGAGHQVAVICPHRRGQPWHETINGVRIYRFPLPVYGTRVASYLLEFLQATLLMTLLTLWVWLREGLDVVHFYNPPDCLFVAALLPKLAGKTIVMDVRDLAPELYKSKYEPGSRVLHGILVWLERAACRTSNHVIVVNQSYRRVVIERDGVRPDQVSVVRQGPDLSHVHLAEPDPELRARAGTIFAYLGKMATQDGVDHLLRALSHLDRNLGYKDWLCVLIGEADDKVGLQQLAAELGVGDRTWFTGYLPYDRWVPILSTADIGVEPAPANPLNNISTMNKLMDYMALGKPSVAYDLAEHRVTSQDAAAYARPNDELDFARQMAALIDDPERRQKMGQIGRKRVETELAWSYQKEHLLAAYGALVLEKNAK